MKFMHNFSLTQEEQSHHVVKRSRGEKTKVCYCMFCILI